MQCCACALALTWLNHIEDIGSSEEMSITNTRANVKQGVDIGNLQLADGVALVMLSFEGHIHTTHIIRLVEFLTTRITLIIIITSPPS
jgi:hypothetical protein